MRIKLNKLLASALAMSAGVMADDYTPRHYQTYFVPAIVFDEKPESSGGGSSWAQAKASNETFLGVITDEVPEVLRAHLGIDPGKGLLVKDTVENSPARKAGFKAHDVLLSVDGQAISSVEQLKKLVVAKKPGTKVPYLMLRAGKKVDGSVTLEKRTADMVVKDAGAWSELVNLATPGEKVAALQAELAAREQARLAELQHFEQHSKVQQEQLRARLAEQELIQKKLLEAKDDAQRSDVEKKALTEAVEAIKRSRLDVEKQMVDARKQMSEAMARMQVAKEQELLALEKAARAQEQAKQQSAEAKKRAEDAMRRWEQTRSAKADAGAKTQDRANSDLRAALEDRVRELEKLRQETDALRARLKHSEDHEHDKSKHEPGPGQTTHDHRSNVQLNVGPSKPTKGQASLSITSDNDNGVQRTVATFIDKSGNTMTRTILGSVDDLKKIEDLPPEMKEMLKRVQAKTTPVPPPPPPAAKKPTTKLAPLQKERNQVQAKLEAKLAPVVTKLVSGKTPDGIRVKLVTSGNQKVRDIVVEGLDLDLAELGIDVDTIETVTGVMKALDYLPKEVRANILESIDTTDLPKIDVKIERIP